MFNTVFFEDDGQEMNTSEDIMVVQDRIIGHRESLYNKLRESKLKSRMIKMYSESFFESLIIKEEAKYASKDSIMEFAQEAFAVALENVNAEDIMNNCESIPLQETFQIMIEEVEEEAKEESEEKIPKTPKEETMDEVSEEDNKNEEDSKEPDEVEIETDTEEVKRANLKGMQNVVRNKVKKVLEREKEISERNKELEEELTSVREESPSMYEYLKNNNKVETIFRTIHKSVVSEYLNESMITVKDRAVQEMMFDEAIIKYTLFEFANTFELVNYDEVEAQNLMEAFKYNL